jgi:DNA-binding MltR family transcriptional regulator
MAAAYLDGELEKFIKAKLVNNERVIKDLFSPNGSLGSFSARIDFAYLLGLISDRTRANLHLLRKIRNDFAHIVSRISFQTSSISSRCNQLKGLGISKISNPRLKFIRSMMNIAAEIQGSSFNISHIEEQSELHKETLEKLEND